MRGNLPYYKPCFDRFQPIASSPQVSHRHPSIIGQDTSIKLYCISCVTKTDHNVCRHGFSLAAMLVSRGVDKLCGKYCFITLVDFYQLIVWPINCKEMLLEI